MTPVLRLVGVWKGFDRGRDRVGVLEDASFEVCSGQIAAVVGSRDQGKTTLIRVASGMLAADQGSVFVDGRELTGVRDGQLAKVLARKIGVATRIGPDAHLNVGDYVEMKLYATREWRGREREEIVRRTLADLGLSDVAEAMWEELSNWQRVLVEFAQAIVVRPRLLLIDDVLDGLGRGKKQAAMELVEDFVEEIGCGVLMAVSDHSVATRSSQVWQLAHGQLKLMHQDPDIVQLDERREPDIAARQRAHDA